MSGIPIGSIRITAPSISPSDASVEVLQSNGQWLALNGVVSVELKIEHSEAIVAQIAVYPWGGMSILATPETTFIECECSKERAL